MKRIVTQVLGVGLAAVVLGLVPARGDRPQAATTEKTGPDLSIPNPASLQRWRDMRFGMFIHWGPVSIKGTEIGWSRGAQVPIEVYDNLYKQFNPLKFNADQWVATARAAGMKYIIFTTKHHDGFCMFDTKQTDYNVMNSAFGRDVVKELAGACKKQGIAFGAYHSVCDWHHPDFPVGSPGGTTKKPHPNLDRYNDYLKKQVAELIHNYGPLITLWFDVPQMFDEKRGKDLLTYTRSLQPDILINDRTGAGGDFSTPEQTVGAFRMNRPWETCMTIANQWAWKPDDPMKSLQQCLRTLITCAGGDGNLLFNVGPMPTGEIEPSQVQRLKEMGEWLSRYGESIYATRGGPYRPTKTLASTRKGNNVYLHIFNWQGEAITLPGLPKQIVSSCVLTGGDCTVKQSAEGITLNVPKSAQQEIDTIIKLELDGPAIDIEPLKVHLQDEIKGTASNVFQHVEEYSPEMAFDGDRGTRWATDGGKKSAWVAADLGKPVSFSHVVINEALPHRVEKFEFQVKDGAEWKTIYSGKAIDAKGFTVPSVSARQVRLNILQANEGPTISEIELER